MMSVRRPASRSSRAVHRRQLRAIGTVAIAGPDVRVSEAVGLKHNFLPIRREVRPVINNASGGNQTGGRPESLCFAFEFNAPDTVCQRGVLISQKITFARNRGMKGHRAYTRDWLRLSSSPANAP